MSIFTIFKFQRLVLPLHKAVACTNGVRRHLATDYGCGYVNGYMYSAVYALSQGGMSLEEEVKWRRKGCASVGVEHRDIRASVELEKRSDEFKRGVQNGATGFIRGWQGGELIEFMHYLRCGEIMDDYVPPC